MGSFVRPGLSDPNTRGWPGASLSPANWASSTRHPHGLGPGGALLRTLLVLTLPRAASPHRDGKSVPQASPLWATLGRRGLSWPEQ